MDNRYGLWRQGSGVWRSLIDGDFEEEDVWAMLKERRDVSPKIGQSMESPVSVQGHPSLPAAARMIPRASTSSSSSASSLSNHESKTLKQQSAPVNIPDWSMIYGKKSKKDFSKNTGSWLDSEDDVDGEITDGKDSDVDENYEDDEEDEEYNKVPPHEFLARRLARSQISSFSVVEGIGRTLKGRDLSKVRNAILTKTGFLE